MSEIKQNILDNKPQVVAFYLPQYHPTKENDEWYGKGFTEWTNVRKAKPLFQGHYQPIVPGELGYYDLRDTQVMVKQAALAHEAGISAFCYYHYWFGGGKMMLEKPLFNMLAEKQIDMPFCLCWANHTWYKKTWDSSSSSLNRIPLLDIHYGDEADWMLHFNSLLPAFQDARYYKVDGRLVFVLYRAQDIPRLADWKALWNRLARENNLPEFYFMTYADDPIKLSGPILHSCEKTILLLKNTIFTKGKTRFGRKLYSYLHEVAAHALHLSTKRYKYAAVRKRLSNNLFAQENIVPTILPNWDNTARRAEGATVLDEATPEQFYLHCRETFAYLHGKQNKLVFLKSWNEWGEGNYMEPDQKYGHGYLQALYRAINEFTD